MDFYFFFSSAASETAAFPIYDAVVLPDDESQKDRELDRSTGAARPTTHSDTGDPRCLSADAVRVV